LNGPDGRILHRVDISCSDEKERGGSRKPPLMATPSSFCKPTASLDCFEPKHRGRLNQRLPFRFTLRTLRLRETQRSNPRSSGLGKNGNFANSVGTTAYANLLKGRRYRSGVLSE
jgi:hypothetical protein